MSININQRYLQLSEDNRNLIAELERLKITKNDTENLLQETNDENDRLKNELEKLLNDDTQLQSIIDKNDILKNELEKLQDDTSRLITKLANENKDLTDENNRLQSRNDELEAIVDKFIVEKKKLNDKFREDIKKLEDIVAQQESGTSSEVIIDKEIIYLQKYLTDNEIDIVTLNQQIQQRFFWRILFTIKLFVEASHSVHIWYNCSIENNREYHCIINDERYFFFILEIILFILLFKILLEIIISLVINGHRVLMAILRETRICVGNCFRCCSRINCCLSCLLFLFTIVPFIYWGFLELIYRRII
jgi:hypothetical protein